MVLAGLLAGLLAAGSAATVGAQDLEPASEFHFTRGIYSGPGDADAWGPRWAIDYPEADRHFLIALRRLTSVDAFPDEHALDLSDPSLARFPFVYVLEVGAMALDDEEAAALRRYLLAGGFLVVDDFWGTWAWENFAAQMARVFPDRSIEEIPLDHPVFHAFYDIDALVQVPNVYQAGTDRTHEYDGRVPHARGIFDDAGRLMVLVNWNTDLGDAWEWADNPDYPLRYSTYAYELGINFVIYAMSH